MSSNVAPLCYISEEGETTSAATVLSPLQSTLVTVGGKVLVVGLAENLNYF